MSVRILLAAVASITVWSQTPPPPVISRVHVMVKPGQTAAYEAYVKDYLTKVARARVAGGEITSYIVSRVLVPGRSVGYSHVISTTWAKEPHLAPSDEWVNKFYTQAGVSLQEARAKRDALGVENVRTEIWRALERTGSLEVGDLIRFDGKHLKPGTGMEYANLERTIWKKVHEERQKMGLQKGWNLLALQLPGGSEAPYQFATVEVFKDEAQMFGPSQMGKAFNAAHGEANTFPQRVRMGEIMTQRPSVVLKVIAVVR
jgi:hypothetical protein